MGKTTVSHSLATKLNAHYIDITELVKTQNLVTSIDKERDTLVADTTKVTKQLQNILATTEGNIIIEGHYAVDVVAKEQVNTVFVLRRDPRELKTVLEQREYSEKKIYENLAAEILDVCLLDAISTCGVDKVCEFDVSNKTVETVTNLMILVLEKKQNCKIGTIDWLGKLEKTGQLEEFLNQH